jgi:hypothetical protein
VIELITGLPSAVVSRVNEVVVFETLPALSVAVTVAV